MLMGVITYLQELFKILLFKHAKNWKESWAVKVLKTFGWDNGILIVAMLS